jgi:hypothetical protein
MIPDKREGPAGRNAVFQPHIAKAILRALILTPHRNSHQKGINRMHGITFQSPREQTSLTFSAA